MITSAISFLLFFVSMISLFFAPRELFGSYYDESVLIRCVASIIFLLIAMFPAFGKNQIGRYIVFIALSVGIAVGATAGWMWAVMKYGFERSFIAFGIIAALSLIYIVFFEKRKQWRMRLKLFCGISVAKQIKHMEKPGKHT